MMLKHAVILTEDLLANDTIIDEGLRAFVAIVKDLGWQYGYVGASIKKRLLGPVKLERSIPVKGTQLRKGLPAPPPNITPPFVSNYHSTFVTTGSLPLYRRCSCCRDHLLINMAVCCIGKHRSRLQSKHDVHRLAHQARLLGYRHLYRHGTASKKLYPVLKLRTDIIVTCTYHAVLVSNDQCNGRRGAVI
jgi:hypothetical protein